MNKNKNRKIPELAIPRLSLYYRALLESGETDIISSEGLASLTDVTAAQVRRDLTYFGQFGTPGKGYNVNELRTYLSKILGTDRSWSVALVGVGNLGSALLHYDGFRKQGFNIICAFDNNERKIGKVYGQVKVQDVKGLRNTLRNKGVKIAIVVVPAEAAQGSVDQLIKGGVKAILNFTPFRPQVPDSVELLNMDLSIELERLAYFLTKEQKEAFFP